MTLIFVFLASSVMLWFGMLGLPGTYDEGILLTAAMRIVAGQIPHQDFYFIYGPAEPYALAGFFKLFGQSLAIERLISVCIGGSITAVTYRIASKYCTPRVARITTLIALLWICGLNEWSFLAIFPVSLLNLIITELVLPIFTNRPQANKLIAAGLLTGLSELLRYDTGLAMIGVQACVFAVAIGFRLRSNAARFKEYSLSLGLYLIGFATAIIPALIYYLSVAEWSAFRHDLIDYPSRYYYRARNLPMPGIHLKSLDQLAVYLPIIIVSLSLYVGLRGCSRYYNITIKHKNEAYETPRWHGLLVSLGLLSFLMYFKGLVRVSPVHMYLSISPTILIIGVLFEYRATFGRYITMTIKGLMALSIMAATLVMLHEIHTLHKFHAWVPQEILSRAYGKLPTIQEEWCKTPGPLTTMYCFIPDNDRIQTINFIRTHTKPTDRLFVGTTRHDKIFSNDNITYFATQRLPATHWSHFDPDLQSRLDVQQMMVQEFDSVHPPYVIMDAEYDTNKEPNDSTRSSGVSLLDDYLSGHYTSVEKHGMLTIYRWNGDVER